MIEKLIFLLCINIVFTNNLDNSVCDKKFTCGSCISNADCMWCLSVPNTMDEVINRCVHKDKQPNGWCPSSEIFFPQSFTTILSNKSLQSKDKNEFVQITPQHIKMSIKVGQEVTIPIEYQNALDFPVDLYYLMDLSSSMADDKIKLLKLGSTLISAMKNITNNFRIGFGIFVDKVEMPYTNTNPEKLKNPCNEGLICAPPYGFKNQLPLTNKTELFLPEIESAPISGNYDLDEGGFDALMQVIVCTQEIGWRENARKLVIFATDSGFHFAGDGKLGGIIEPNDELCHLDENGLYTHSLLQDYPTIPMLDANAKKHNINIIFATSGQFEENIYRDLTKNYIHGASFGKLSNDSSNIVPIVVAEYQKIINTVSLSDDTEGSIEIKYFTKCLGNEEKQTNECKYVNENPVIKFNAVLKAIKCPENKDKFNQIINIKPGTLYETLKIQLEIICQCDCEKTEIQTKSDKCSNHGILQCGICSCDPDRDGKHCECDASEIKSGKEENCKPNNSTERICNGLGFCKCGKCECNKRNDPTEKLYGTYCECDNYSCKRNGGLLCSGPERGHCECGQCVCEAGWGGLACECSQNTDTCISPTTGEICSGQGVCNCGSCECNLTDKFRFSGKYCEECPYCTENKCRTLKDCVECTIHKTGVYSDESTCLKECSKYNINSTDKIDVDKKLFEEIICKEPDNHACTMVFKYLFKDNNEPIQIFAERTKQCPGDVDITAVIIGVVGSILLASLILLIAWKILTTIHDRREYSKFKKETANAKWGTEINPMYKPSIFSYKNPAFRRSRQNSQSTSK